MLNKKTISLLLIVGLFSSATMHPIWGFNWLFGSSNQTSKHADNNHKKYAFIGAASVLGAVAAFSLARYLLSPKPQAKLEQKKRTQRAKRSGQEAAGLFGQFMDSANESNLPALDDGGSNPVQNGEPEYHGWDEHFSTASTMRRVRDKRNAILNPDDNEETHV